MTTRKKAPQSRAPLFDDTVRPQDDFFGYVNNIWLRDNPIPDDKSRWGTFDMLQDQAWQNLRTLYEALQNTQDLLPSTVGQQTRDLYYTAMHMDQLEAQHLQDVREQLAKIAAVTDMAGLSQCVGELQDIGVEAPWNLWVDSDNKDSKKHLLHFSQDGLTLPNRDYYLGSDDAMRTIRNAYQQHLRDVYDNFPFIAESAEAFCQIILDFEKNIAEHSRTDAALRDIEENYHKTPYADLKQIYTNVDWDTYAAALGWQPDDKISIDQPEFLAFINDMFVPSQLGAWKVYLQWHFLVRYYGRISERFAQLKFEFFGVVLGGTKKILPSWKRAMHVVDDAIGEAVGKLYVEQYFPESAKQQVLELVEMVRAAYADRIEKLEWMTPPTKEYALIKLANIKVLAAYPDIWRDFSGLKIGRMSLIANIMAAERFNNGHFLHRLHQPTSRDEWFMHPQTVNAYHDPNRLVICFPAAILAAPFFDPAAPLAVNLGGIGAVIGHELTHGFDDQGCQFDAEGNVRVWQTDQDRAEFNKRAAIIIKQADEYQVLPGLHMQGDLVIGESIADLGGIEIAYTALQKSLGEAGDTAVPTSSSATETPRPRDLSPQQLFFVSSATSERSATRDEKKREYALTDPHPDGIFRINCILQHVDGFYEAFNIVPGDALFRAVSDRAKIW